MNKLFLLFCILFILVFSSCKDIVDSEDNINKTKITYGYVKADQEHNVIMPLKVGNRWLYKVTEYDSIGGVTKIYLDSIVVNQEVLIKGERWFKVYFPQFGNNIFLTNTDVGLMYSCDECNVFIALLAQYPVTSNQFISHIDKNIAYYSESDGKYGTIDVYWSVKINQPISLKYDSNNYEGIGYLNSCNVPEKPEIIGIASYYENFVPDYGLFEYKLYHNINGNLNYLEKTYELIKYSGLQSNNLTQNIFEIDFGDINIGNSKQLTVENLLNNDTEKGIYVKNITINLKQGTYEILSPTQNIILSPGENLTITIRCAPTSIGKGEAILQLLTENENYNVKLKYNCK